MASQTNHGKPRTYFANNARVAKTQRGIEKVMSQIQFRSSCKGRMNAKLTTETNSQRVFAARNLKSTPRLDRFAVTSYVHIAKDGAHFWLYMPLCAICKNENNGLM